MVPPFPSSLPFFFSRKPRKHYFFSVRLRENTRLLSPLRFSQRARRLLASGVQIIRRLLLPHRPLLTPPPSPSSSPWCRQEYFPRLPGLLLLLKECFALSFLATTREYYFTSCLLPCFLLAYQLAYQRNVIHFCFFHETRRMSSWKKRNKSLA